MSTYEELIAAGAKPHTDQTQAPKQSLTFEQLQQMGAKPHEEDKSILSFVPKAQSWEGGDTSDQTIIPNAVTPNANTIPAAIEGIGNRGTFGHLPQIQAAAGSMMGLGDRQKLQDEYIKYREGLYKSNPGAYAAGGTVAEVAKGAGLGKLIGAAPTMARAFTGNAAMGGLENPGDTKGESSGLQLPERASNALKTGVFGAALHGLFGQKSPNTVTDAGTGESRSMTDYETNPMRGKVGSSLTGLNKTQAETYMQNPELVEGYAQQPELARSEAATGKIQSVAKKISDQFTPLEQQVQSAVQGKDIPAEAVRGAEKYLPKDKQYLAQPNYNMRTGQSTIPAKNVLEINRYLKNQHVTWSLNPDTGEISSSSNPEVGKIISNAKNALPEEVRDAFGKMSDLYDAQEFINKALKTGRPLGALRSTQPDVEAMKQLADRVAGGRELQNLANMEQISGILYPKASQPLTKEGVTHGISKFIGKGLLKSGSSSVPTQEVSGAGQLRRDLSQGATSVLENPGAQGLAVALKREKARKDQGFQP